MPSSVVKEQIYKLKLDAADLQQKLQNAIKDVGNFQQKMDSINGKSVDNVEKSTGSLSSKLAGLVSHVPILGNIVEKMTGVGNASNTAASAVGRVGENAGSGFGAIQSGASNAKNSMEQLGSGVEGVKGKFSMLEGIATVALGNIASRAITAGASLLNKWTLAPIVQGYQEYERELDSTRILVAALGDQEQDHITRVMRDLEQYAKTTKYNSQQMNSSLAQFVNAGIDLDKANVALKGFGNLAASAGATTAQFGSALQFGVQQALQMGYMNRQNWMSMENANLATRAYKEAVINAAIAQGTLTQEQVDAVGVQQLFVEHLKDGWLTNEVLMQSLEEYANNPVYQKMAENVYTFKEAMEATEEAVNDAWSKMWVELAGKGDQAMAIWTPVSQLMANTVSFIPNMIAQIAHAFNQLDGRTHLISAIVEAFNSLKTIGEGVKNAIAGMFPESSKFRQWAEDGDKTNMVFVKIAETIIKITDYLKNLFHINDDVKPKVVLAIQNIVEVFLRLWNIVKSVAKGILAALDLIIPDNLIQDLILIAGMVANVFNGIGRIFDGIKSQLDGSGIANAFNTIRTALQSFWDSVTTVLSALWGRLDGPMDTFFDKVGVNIGKFLNDVAKMFGFGKDADSQNSLSFLERMANAFKNLTDKFAAWADAFKNGPKPGETDKIALFFEKAGRGVNVFLNGVKLLLSPLAILYQICKSFIVSILPGAEKSKINDNVDKLRNSLEKIHGVAEKAGKALLSFFKPNAKYEDSALKSIIDAFSKSDTIANAIKTISEAFKTFWGSFKGNMSKTDAADKFTVLGNIIRALGDTLRSVSDQFDNVSHFLGNTVKAILHFIDDLAEALNGNGLLKMAVFYIIINNLKNFKEKLKDTIDKILHPIKTLKEFLSGGLGLEKVGLFKELKNTLGTMQKSIKADALKKIATALLELAGALFVVALIPSDKLLPAVGAIAAMATILTGVYWAMNKIKGDSGGRGGGLINSIIEGFGFPEISSLLKKIGAATMVIALATSVVAIGTVFNKLASNDWDSIKRGLTVVGGIMTELVAASWLTGFSKASLGSAATLYVISQAVKQISKIIKDLSAIDGDSIDTGMARLEKVGLLIASIMALMGLDVSAGIGVSDKFKIGASLSTSNQSFGTAATLFVLMHEMQNIMKALDLFAGETNPGKIEAKKQSIDAGVEALKSILTAIAGLVAIMGGSLTAGAEGSGKVKGTFGNATGLTGLKITTGNTKWSMVGVLTTIIIGIKEISNSISQLGSLDPDKLQQGSSALTKIAYVLGGLYLAITLITGRMKFKGKDKSFTAGSGTNWKLVGVITSIVIGVKLLSDTLLKLGSSSVDSLKRGTLALSVVSGIMIVLISAIILIEKYLTKNSNFKISKAYVAALASSILGVKLLSDTVIKLGSVDAGKLKQGELHVSIISAILVGIIASIVLISGLATKLDAKTKTIAVLTIAMGVIVLSLRSLSNTVMSLGAIESSNLIKGSLAVSAISLVLLGIMEGVTLISKQMKGLSGIAFIELIGSIVIIIFGLKSLAKRVSELGELDTGVLEQGLLAVTAISLILSGVLEAITLISNQLATNLFSAVTIVEVLATLIIVIGSLYLLGAEVKSLGKMKEAESKQGVVALASIGGIIAVLTTIVSLLGMFAGNSGGMSLAGMAFVIGLMIAITADLFIMAKTVKDLGSMSLGDLTKGVVTITLLGTVLTALTVAMGAISLIAGFSGMTLVGMVVLIPLIISLVWSLKTMGETVSLLGGLSVGELFKGGAAIAALGQVLFILTTEFGVLALLAGWSFGALWGIIPVIALIMAIVPALQGMGDIVISLAPLSIGDLMSGAVAILALGVILVVITALATVVSIFGTFAGLGVATTIALANGIIQALQSLANVVIGLVPYAGIDMLGAVMTIAGLALILGALSAFMSLMSNVTSLEGAAGQIMIMQGITTSIQSLASTAITIAGVGDIETMTKAGQIVAKLGDVIGWNTLKTAFGSLISGGADKISGQLSAMKGIVTNVKDLADTAIKISASGSSEDMQKSADVVKKLANVLTSNLFKEDFLSVFSDGSGAVTRIKNGAKALASVSDASKSASSMKSIDVEGVSDKMDDMKTIMNKAKSMGDSAPSEQAVTNMGNMNSIINKVKDIATNLQSMPAVGPEATVAVDNIIATINSISTKLQSMEMNQSFEAAGLGNIGSYATGIQNGLGNVTGSVDGVVNGARGRFGSANMTSQGNNTSSTFGRGISALLGMVSGAASGVVNGAKGMFGQNDVTGHGNRMSGTFKGGIDSGRNPVSNAAKSVLDAAKSAMTPDGGVISKLTHAGTSMVDAIAGGIRSAIGKATSAISDLWATVKAHIPNSPAKKGPMSGAGWRKVEHSGKTIVETIASGMGSAAPTVIDAMDNLMGEIQNQVDRVNDMDYDNMDINPKIKPILDMSQVETSALQAVTDYSGLLTGQTALNLQYSLLNPQVAQMLTNSDNINTLIGKVETLNGQMGELNVVNQEQAGLLREGQVLNTYIDGKRINNVLAPGMADAQLQYKARQDRINGGIA
jgi:putative tail protein|nr:MAG TPA: tail tape measure [Caudoviricetes sp.]